MANVWAVKDGSYFLDYATLNSTLSMAYGLSDTWLVEVEAQDVQRFNSILDPITIAFHDFFGLDQNGRDEHPRNEDILFIEGRDGVPTIDITESGSEVRSLALTLQNNVTCGTQKLPAISWAATVRGCPYRIPYPRPPAPNGGALLSTVARVCLHVQGP